MTALVTYQSLTKSDIGFVRFFTNVSSLGFSMMILLLAKQ